MTAATDAGTCRAVKENIPYWKGVGLYRIAVRVRTKIECIACGGEGIHGNEDQRFTVCDSCDRRGWRWRETEER